MDLREQQEETRTWSDDHTAYSTAAHWWRTLSQLLSV